MALKIMKLATKNKFILLISGIFSTIVVNFVGLSQQTGKLTKQLAVAIVINNKPRIIELTK